MREWIRDIIDYWVIVKNSDCIKDKVSWAICWQINNTVKKVN